MTTYSAFFSSGLLAAPQASSYYNSMPSIPSSPSMMSEALDDASDFDIDRFDRDRSTTPTPSTLGAVAGIVPTAGQQPRLRKRRSSLTMGANSALNAIKSPMRSVNNAFQVQRHLMTPCRSRSGSLSSVVDYEEPEPMNVIETTPTNNDANKRKSRLRSGSVGTALKPRKTTPARLIPRAVPPPSAPLPPLPPMPLSPSHAKSFSIPPNAFLGQKLMVPPPMPSLSTFPSSPMLTGSRQVLGEMQV